MRRTRRSWSGSLIFLAVSGTAGSLTPVPVAGQQVRIRLEVAPLPPGGSARPQVRARAAALLPNGQAIVIDDRTRSVLVIGGPSATSDVPAVALEGGRLADPVAVAVDGPGTALVLDRQPPRVVRVGLAGGKLRALSSQAVGLAGTSAMCAVKGVGSFLIGNTQPVSGSKLIYVIDDGGRVTRSFGEMFGQGGDGVRLAYSRGTVTCFPAQRRVIIVSALLPELRAYTTAGQLLWTSPLAQFRGISVVEETPGFVKYNYPPDGEYDQVVSTFTPGDGIIAVQVGRRARGPEAHYASITTHLFSTSNGAVVGLQTDLPLILAAERSRAVVAASSGSGVDIVNFSLVR